MRGPSHRRAQHFGSRAFVVLAQASAIAVAGLLVAIALTLLIVALPAIQTYGLSFLTGRVWDPVAGQQVFGVLPMIIGTAASSGLALLLAVPVGVGSAIFLSEDFLPLPLQRRLVSLVELLAAIPSVVYGFWGLVVLIPRLQPLGWWLHTHLGWMPLFSTPPVGPGLLPAAIVLAIMIVPLITAIAWDALMAVPLELRLAAAALGASRWSALLGVLIPAAGAGIMGVFLLALGRALGETMAVTMVIGNANQLSPSLLAPANTLASLLVNQFTEARGMQISALMYAGLVLLLISSLLVNLLADWIVRGAHHRSRR
ncbi:phosphate ABC transporter permease subunit PstC [Halomicronema hongdechloris]|uniref:phosphate ABC transporter permease subunit PstC n=1 Tax=Halomicronema hongdechloris TaxID=1209493 RepID=UPI001930F010